MKLRYKQPFFNWLAQLFQKVSGVPPLTMPRAVAGGLKRVAAYGGLKLQANGVPVGYTAVDWVSNNANTLVPTGVVIHNGEEFEIEITCTAVLGSFFLFQARDVISSGVITGLSGAAADNSIALASGFPSATVLSQITRVLGRRFHFLGTCTSDTLTLTVEASTYSDTSTASFTAGSTGRPSTDLCLFGNKAASSDPSASANRLAEGCKVEFAKLKINGTYVLDLKPVTRDSDGTPGFINLVDGTFLTATEGSLNAGPVTKIVPTPDVPADLICNNGKLIPYLNAEGSSTQNGTPSPSNPIEIQNYTQGSMVLRGIGDYKDVYNSSTKSITRKIGVKVFNGTEDWLWTDNANAPARLAVPETISADHTDNAPFICSHFEPTYWDNLTLSTRTVPYVAVNATTSASSRRMVFTTRWSENITDLESWKQFLTDQYNAGTPVTIYYPLAIEVTETWNDVVYVEGTQETVKLTTRNLFNFTDLSNKNVLGVDLTVADDGWVTIDGDTTATYYSEFIYTLSNPLPEGTYTVSLNNDKTISSQSALLGLLVDGVVSTRGVTFSTLDRYKTITIPSGSICDKIVFRITSVSNMKVRLQIEKGDMRTSYVPFNDCRATAEHLLKVLFYGRTYKDEQNIISGSLIRKCTIKIFDGSETLLFTGTSATVNRFSAPLSDCEQSFSTNTGTTTICSHITSRISNTVPWTCYIFNKRFYMVLPADIFQTTQDVNNWLTIQYNAGTPVIVVYPLATSVTEQVEPQALNTVAGINTLEITQASLTGLELTAEYKRR